MRRIVLLAASLLALALAVPGAALAHGGGHHKAHGTKSCVPPGAARAAHHGWDEAEGDAGTIASFADPVLTIRLADGSTLSGRVTERTRITCKVAFTPSASTSHHSGDDGGRGDFRGHRGKHRGWTTDVSALVPGAIVHEADLRIGSGGAEFKQIELVTPSA